MFFSCKAESMIQQFESHLYSQLEAVKQTATQCLWIEKRNLISLYPCSYVKKLLFSLGLKMKDSRFKLFKNLFHFLKDRLSSGPLRQEGPFIPITQKLFW